ncbi:MAG TPA: phospholipase [Bacteroidales bacterium]|nr:phospholipase [Bacteroidales bacterium]
MKRIIISAIMVIVAKASISQVSEMYKAEIFKSNGIQLPYRILHPKNFDTAKQYPLVLFLHGAGERGTDNVKQLTHGANLFAADSVMENYPAIVVFPQCPANSYWANIVEQKHPDGSRTFDFPARSKPTPAMSAVMQLLDSLVRLKYIDRNRIYVGGLSMGGMGTFELLARRPKLFAAAFPICGGGNPKNAKRYAQRVNLWVFHGAADNVVPPYHSQRMVDAIKQAKGNVHFTIYPGVEHNSWDNAFAEPELLPWLFSNCKK